LEKEYSGDDPQNPYLRVGSYYDRWAKNGVKIYKLTDKNKYKTIRKEYLEGKLKN
jgi:hypothetical protein